MAKDTIDIQKLAELARIELTEEEAGRYQKEIESILGYIARIQDARTDGVNPADREPGVVRSVFREDSQPHESGVYTDDLLNEAPASKDGYVKVKKIL